jgi:hypothetical protein
MLHIATLMSDDCAEDNMKHRKTKQTNVTHCDAHERRLRRRQYEAQKNKADEGN